MVGYHKAVRDRIPEIIRGNGQECGVEKLGDSEFLEFMEEKLMEELGEYFDSGSVDELADLVDSCYRVAELKGTNRESFDEIRKKKWEESGGFDENLVLTEIYQNPQECGLGLCSCERSDLVFEDE